MKKLWLLLILVVIVACQVAVLSSFHSINTNTWANGSTAVVISKAAYAHLKVEICVNPYVFMGKSQTTLIFPNGTQTEIPTGTDYKFSLTLPSSGPSPGSFAIQSAGIDISDNPPDRCGVFVKQYRLPTFPTNPLPISNKHSVRL
jgi:hypothetical protein